MVTMSTAAGSAARSTDFELLPAIDLRDGRVVRLVQGDFAAETDFGDDPVAIALGFVEAGARWLHIVDLTGARAGGPQQAELIRQVVAGVGEAAACEIAGGLRDRAAVATALGLGASRVAVGTAALAEPGFARDLVRIFGARRVAVALDVRDGLAVGEGWRAGAGGVVVETALGRLAADGVTTFEVTAIDRDGLLGGPDLELLGRLVALGGGRIIASGGIRSIDDLQAVRALGCAGAIVGRALYDGSLDLAQAVSVLRN
jgi:phosphoribosylformimino-5-aminoimidazole carboxamide ribotide isomerase